MAEKRTTIKDVAKLADVSVQTVSNVLNGRSKNRMKEATRQRVLEAIAKLDYHPNAMAARLRSNRVQTIVFAVFDPSPNFLADAFTAEVLSAAAHEARRQGYKLLLYGSTEPTAGDELGAMLRSREADGLILLPSGSVADWGATLERVASTQQPFAVVQSDIELPQPGLSSGVSVCADDFAAGKACGELLADLGHRRLLFVTTRASWAAVEKRLGGIRDVCDRRGMEPPHVVTAADYSIADADEAVSAFLREDASWRPTAIVGANDILALGALNAARRAGLHVPGTLSVMGFDDLDVAGAATPALTTVRVPALEIGAQAAASVVARIEDPDLLSEPVILPVELIRRESTDRASSERG